MPIQKFAPMTKDFPTFDCDAHVAEPPWIWERAKDWLTKDELEALKATMWYDAGTKQLIVNGTAGAGLGSQRIHGNPGMVNVLSLAGPGMKHDIQRAINVRNLNPKTALTAEQADYIDHKGAYKPEERLKDMDVQGIDQVMIIPSDIDTYPWLQNALGAKAMCKAYNEWAYEYCQEDPNRIFFAAMLPMQDPVFTVQEIHRVAAKGCRVGLVRPVDAMGNYPLQPKYAPVWRAMEETGVVYGMHPFPAMGALKPPGYSEQYSGAELVAKTIISSGLPHFFLTNVQNFQAEAALWVTMVLMSGFFERYPKINAAVFEASSTWLSFLLDECDKFYKLYRNERQLPPLKRLPSETFFEHCVTGFEGDEAPPSRLPEFYGDILAWSSDVYHHDGDDVWRALETMQACNLPESYQAKFLGQNARKMYNIETPKTFIRERVTEIERPDWWPTEEEVQQALKPESAMTRPYGEAGKSVVNATNGNGANGNGRANGHVGANGHATQGARA
jgi:predicted TIM-barrel fold metal-dependent hydrolase